MAKVDIFTTDKKYNIGELPRIELFARQHAEGWDCWGNEV